MSMELSLQGNKLNPYVRLAFGVVDSIRFSHFAWPRNLSLPMISVSGILVLVPVEPTDNV